MTIFRDRSIISVENYSTFSNVSNKKILVPKLLALIDNLFFISGVIHRHQDFKLCLWVFKYVC